MTRFDAEARVEGHIALKAREYWIFLNRYGFSLPCGWLQGIYTLAIAHQPDGRR